MSAPGRIHAFDWLRGVAVVVMIQTHAVVLLQKALEGDALFRRLMLIDGLVAPSFIFSAGFALALVQVRVALAARSLPADQRESARSKQAKKSLKRIAEVLAVATLVNLIWFRLDEPKWLLRLDILHCIGLSLLLVLPLLTLLGARPGLLRWVLLALAGVIFGLAPIAERAGGVASIFLNTRVGALDDTLGSAFPLFPWSGYVFLGGSFGATVAMMQREATLWRWWALLVGLGGLLWATDGFWRAAYGAHAFYVTNPANAAQRWTLVLLVVAMFRALERLLPSSPRSRIATVVGTFGTSSLSAYFFHEMLLYQRHVGIFTKLFRERCDWLTFWPVLAALVLATWACVRVWDRVDARLRARFLT